MTPDRLLHVTEPEYYARVISDVADLLSGRVLVPAEGDLRLLHRWQLDWLRVSPPPDWGDPMPWAMRVGFVRGLCRALSRGVCGEPVSPRDVKYRELYPQGQLAQFRPEVVLCLRGWDPDNPRQAAERLEAARLRLIGREM